MGGDYTRHCPDPEKITAFLKQTLDFDGVLTAASRICKPCYSFHRQILLQEESGISTSMQTLHSIASDLDSRVKQFETQERNSASDKSFLAWNVSKICLQLVRTLQSEEAVLLPHPYAEFCQQVFQTIDMFPSVTKTLKANPPSIRWLLSSISNHLGDNLGVTCRHRKYGTLLYRKHGDILNALSKALGKAQQPQNNEISMRKDCRLLAQPLVKSEANKVLSDESILQACTALNMRMNKQIRTLIQKYQKDPLLCAAFNPETLIHELDPLLVQCIQVLTRPVRER